MGQCPADLVKGATCTGGDIENAQACRGAVVEMTQAAFQGRDDATSHRVGRAIEEDFDLQVVELSGVVAEVAVGLVVEILEVIVGVQGRFGVLRQIPDVALLAAAPH